MRRRPWARAFKTEIGAEGPEARPHNLLVVSDLHFGETLAPSDPGYAKQVARLNTAFSRFLEYYAAQRVDGRPWRLVIAGDMIDFVRAGVVARQAREAEGIPELSGARGAVLALEHIVQHHRRLFSDLAAFVAAGNELVIIKGNHDVEFHWRDVQRRFIEILCEVSADPELARRIVFCRWFWYERDLVYIEHGNQYDEFCSFEHVLAPTIPEERQLEDPISHQTFRAFANMVDGLDIHAIERWKIIDYVRWLSGLAPRMIGRLAYTYFASLSWMFETRSRLARAARLARRQHRRRFKEVSRRFSIKEEVLVALDNLRERPAGNSVFSGIQMLYMDRIFVGVATVLFVLGALVAPGGLELRASVAGGWMALALAALLVLARLRNVEAHPKLMRVAERVRRLMRVPIVVFGHSHVPVAKALPGEADSWYFNTGSWAGDAAGGLTHLCITVGTERPCAELRRWDLKSHKPCKVEV